MPSPAADQPLLKLLANACTPLERASFAWLRCGNPDLAHQRFARWLALCVKGDVHAGLALLRRRGMDVEEWIKGLGSVEVVGQPEGVDWARSAAALWRGLSDQAPAYPQGVPSLGEVVGAGLPAWADAAAPWRFFAAFEAWMAGAQTHIAQCLGEQACLFTPGARHDLVLTMVRRLLALAGPRLMEATGKSDPDASRFVANPAASWLALWGQYPVLLRLMAVAWQQWREVTEELLQRIVADLPTLAPGARVVQVSGGQGDGHAGGRAVVAILTDQGSTWYLKPHATGAYRALGDLLARLDAMGERLGLRLPVTHERAGYCWVSAVERQSARSQHDIARYFFRAGALLRLMQMLGATDLHQDNFIPTADQAVLIDLETVFGTGPMAWSATARPAQTAPDLNLIERLSDTPFATSMVSSPIDGPAGAASVDIGAMASPNGRATPYAVPELVLAEDGPRLQRARAVLMTGAALPTLDGIKVPVDGYTDAVIAGYADMQDRLLKLDITGLAQACRAVRMRFVPRATNVYARLLQESLSVTALGDGVERELVLERLWLAVDSCPQALIAAEQQALRQLDVPFFSVDMGSIDLLAAPGGVIAGVFVTSPLNRLRSRLQALAQLAAVSTGYKDDVQAALFAVAPLSRPIRSIAPPARLAPESPAQTLLRQAIPLAGGELAWVGLAYDPSRFRWQHQRLGAGLLGAAGVALALLLATASHDLPVNTLAQCRATLLGCARRVIQTRPGWDSVDAFAGPAGTLYALAKAAKWSSDESLLASAWGLLPEVVAKAALVGTGTSAGPLAGAVLAILSLPACPARTKALERLAEMMDQPRRPGGDHLHDPWAGALLSAPGALALARHRLGALPGFAAVRDVASAAAPLPALTWQSADAAAQMLIGQGPVGVDWEQRWWPDATSSQRILDCADLARTAWLVTADTAWLARYQKAWGALQDAKQHTGRWFGDILLPDSRNLSALHGMAAVLLLGLDQGASTVMLRVLG